MKRFALFTFTILIGAVGLAGASAQTMPTQPPQTIYLLPQPGMGGCPVSLRAQQVGSAGMLAAEKGPPKGTGQGLHLILMSPDLRKIAGATVTVRGLTAKGRVVQALSNQADSSDTARTLNVTFVAGEGKEAAADLWVEGMTAVRTVNLNSVTFVDGSTWKPLAGSSCRVVPDPMMLINGR